MMPVDARQSAKGRTPPVLSARNSVIRPTAAIAPVVSHLPADASSRPRWNVRSPPPSRLNGGDRNRDIFVIGFNHRCGGDDERGARQYAHPEHQEVVEIQSRAEEDDAQRQDSLDHEVRTGSELPGYGHEIAKDQAE